MAADSRGHIAVIGTTGAGKSTLAAEIAARTGRQLIDLDDLRFLPGWVERADADFHDKVRTALDAAKDTGWVTAGNYSQLNDLIWPRADYLVVLDYAPVLVFWRLLCRSLRRCVRAEPCCNGNRETFAKLFFSRDSILLWFFKSFQKKRRRFQTLAACPPGPEKPQILYHRTPAQTEAWLQQLPAFQR